MQQEGVGETHTACTSMSMSMEHVLKRVRNTCADVTLRTSIDMRYGQHSQSTSHLMSLPLNSRNLSACGASLSPILAPLGSFSLRGM